MEKAGSLSSWLNIRLKHLGMILGICLVAGSLSACGNDTPVMYPVMEPLDSEISVDDQEPTVQMVVMEPLNNESQTDSEEVTEVSHNEETVVEQPEIISVTISAAGDVTLGTHHEQDYYYSFTQAYDQTEDDGYFFENVYDIFAEDDMTLVNLEGPLTNAVEMREGQTYSIKGAPEYVNILAAGSVEAVSMANNHRLDYLEQGSRDTVTALEQAGIVYAYDKSTCIYETKGIRIGCISVNEVGWGAGVEALIQEGMEQLRQQQADLIMVSCHWGIEREYYPEEYQKQLGRKCIDWGADLVLGHHPHVLQGIEEYQGKYIVYSLGNFCFGANRNPEDKDTIIFQQTFSFEAGKKLEEAPIRIIPCSVSSVQNRNDFRPTPLTGDAGRGIIDRINEYSMEFGVYFDENGYKK